MLHNKITVISHFSETDIYHKALLKQDTIGAFSDVCFSHVVERTVSTICLALSWWSDAKNPFIVLPPRRETWEETPIFERNILCSQLSAPNQRSPVWFGVHHCQLWFLNLFPNFHPQISTWVHCYTFLSGWTLSSSIYLWLSSKNYKDWANALCNQWAWTSAPR